MSNTIESYTIEQIKEGNAYYGWQFFNPGAVTLFDSKVESDVFNTDTGVYFITSEITPPSKIRHFSVRQYIPEDGQIRTISENVAHDLIDAEQILERHIAKIRLTEYPGDLI